MAFDKGAVPHNKLDLVGQKFGRLLVLDNDLPKKRKSMVLCLCDCGKQKIVGASYLKRGITKSCGCLAIETRTKYIDDSRIQDREQVNYTKVLRSYKKTAKEKNNNWNITDKRAFELFKMNCFYCNTGPSNRKRDSSDPNFITEYTGIDRLDNSLGYEDFNVVPCCKKCNHRKRAEHFSDFRDWINVVHKNLNDKLKCNMNSSKELIYGT